MKNSLRQSAEQSPIFYGGVKKCKIRSLRCCYVESKQNVEQENRQTDSQSSDAKSARAIKVCS